MSKHIWNAIAALPSFAAIARGEDASHDASAAGDIGFTLDRETDAGDAARGWAITCNRMAREGLRGWDANTQSPIAYDMPWSKGGEKGPKAWSRSVPYNQTIIEPLGSYGEGEFEGHWLDALARLGWIAGVKELSATGASGGQRHHRNPR